MRLIEEAQRHAVICIDPLHLARSGGSPADVQALDTKYFPYAQISDGFLEGHEIECPLHQGRFDVRTGAALWEPLACDVERYDVKIENGDVLVGIDADSVQAA